MQVRILGGAVAIALTLLALLAAPGCHATGEMTGQATDEWARTYPLAAGGELQIFNPNGPIEVEGVDGTTVDVRAERTARGVTDAMARELLPRISIVEDVTPEKITVRTEGIGGLLIGASFQVRYRVRMPRSAVVRLRATNGGLTLRGLNGRIVGNTTNGNIVGEELGGSLEGRTTNGNARLVLTAVGSEGVDVRTTNGNVQLTVPGSVKANLSATCRNGTVEITGVEFKADGEQTRRRVQGRLNGGGPLIRLTTVNGGVRIGGRESAP
jgi:hypothetical protein